VPDYDNFIFIYDNN